MFATVGGFAVRLGTAAGFLHMATVARGVCKDVTVVVTACTAHYHISSVISARTAQQ